MNPKKPAKTTIEVKGTVVSILSQNESDYISLTDIARYRDSGATDDLIRNWLRNRNTIEFLGIWEQLHNPSFNPVEFDGFRMQAGLNSFALTPKQWNELWSMNLKQHRAIKITFNAQFLNATSDQTRVCSVGCATLKFNAAFEEEVCDE